MDGSNNSGNEHSGTDGETSRVGRVACTDGVQREVVSVCEKRATGDSAKRVCECIYNCKLMVSYF